MTEPESQGSSFLWQALLGALAGLPVVPTQYAPIQSTFTVQPTSTTQPIPTVQPTSTVQPMPAIQPTSHQHYPTLPLLTPLVIPFHKYKLDQQPTTGTSTGLYRNPTDLSNWCTALFELRIVLHMSPEQHAIYWPYVDNIWSRNGKERVAKTLGTITNYYRCRL
jgi:hypothetical protein